MSGNIPAHTSRNRRADTHLGDFTSVRSPQVVESFEETIPADILGKLPKLQYFASVSGGRLNKGRFLLLNPDSDRPTQGVTREHRQ